MERNQKTKQKSKQQNKTKNFKTKINPNTSPI